MWPSAVLVVEEHHPTALLALKDILTALISGGIGSMSAYSTPWVWWAASQSTKIW